jgi:hypothetical protein
VRELGVSEAEILLQARAGEEPMTAMIRPMRHTILPWPSAHGLATPQLSNQRSSTAASWNSKPPASGISVRIAEELANLVDDGRHGDSFLLGKALSELVDLKYLAASTWRSCRSMSSSTPGTQADLDYRTRHLLYREAL